MPTKLLKLNVNTTDTTKQYEKENTDSLQPRYSKP